MWVGNVMVCAEVVGLRAGDALPVIRDRAARANPTYGLFATAVTNSTNLLFYLVAVIVVKAGQFRKGTMGIYCRGEEFRRAQCRFNDG